ncbi:unnamed protein product, partial [Toxocara canis]|uniref:Uncharacterized protein n=1 Tax=Toxocara canis TaxID=6265 RepID=A0A183V5R1_TOXCA
MRLLSLWTTKWESALECHNRDMRFMQLGYPFSHRRPPFELSPLRFVKTSRHRDAFCNFRPSTAEAAVDTSNTVVKNGVKGGDGTSTSFKFITAAYLNDFTSACGSSQQRLGLGLRRQLMPNSALVNRRQSVNRAATVARRRSSAQGTAAAAASTTRSSPSRLETIKRLSNSRIGTLQSGVDNRFFHLQQMIILVCNDLVVAHFCDGVQWKLLKQVTFFYLLSSQMGLLVGQDSCKSP